MALDLTTPHDDAILSVGDFTRQVKELLESNLPPCWVRGEISNLRRQQSGHVYFTLKDSRSQLSCVLFRGDAMRQRAELRDGLQVVVYGQVSVYEPRGTHQLICRVVMEDGAGRLQQEFERLKQKLSAEGLFDAERKRPLPSLPRAVGFVTSPTGAAIRDFLSILARRGWRGRIVVIPAQVQGNGAAEQIVAGIEAAQRVDGLDLLVVGRGGGSLEDLWCFNEEIVARAVAACSLPVISAVGHEIDFTLSDFAADKRAETPSAAAELISSGYLEMLDRLDLARDGLHELAARTLERLGHRLDAAGSGLERRHPQPRLEQASLRLDDLNNRLRSGLRHILSDRRSVLKDSIHKLAAYTPESVLRVAGVELKAARERTERASSVQLRQKREYLKQLRTRLENASLKKALDRGFAVARDERGELVCAKSGLKPGQRLALDFRDGEILVRVEDM
ncbi:exodeoxyribonuclease VII large subunit [Ruficoccus sp. ZRK36]|uniref:exodeoxyribonuclease VII large subunit n=1 Tax=Ruficoccus sp. ZRK36 TaxID=2866311 RepID=UPI001C73361C|nr:exodeoxyribonuclease VII large subunit [Ruficoccus sp. ZRK36]QYY37079.1 exodeoxyribonuclease VII large subunit [Ruficoccus sp. ZRK36]